MSAFSIPRNSLNLKNKIKKQKPSFCFVALVLFLLLSSQAFAAEPKTILEVEQATDNYFKNKNWTPFSASIELSFYKQDTLKSTCSGNLLFDPLRKKLLMECFGRLNQPVFVFKNDDLNFLIYLPGMRHAWQGDMFQLEYSPEFDSHLKPLDLYRAVSPEPFSERQVIGAYGVSDGIELEIAKPYQGSQYLARRLILDKKGQVDHETFLAPDGGETTVVTREEFKKIKNKFDSVNSRFYYAVKTSVSHPETGDKTVLVLKNITLYEQFPDDAWVISMPEDVPLDPVAEGKPVYLTEEQRALAEKGQQSD